RVLSQCGSAQATLKRRRVRDTKRKTGKNKYEHDKSASHALEELSKRIVPVDVLDSRSLVQ
ncbi:MAG: hypothetical protein ACF8OB_11135, partial [Phycisphaeraceae bacterium JB051]